MNLLRGWLTTIGLAGGVAGAAVLAIGGGTVALHHSSLLERSHAIPVVIQPVAETSSIPTLTSPTPEDRPGADVEAADDNGMDVDAADDNGADVAQASTQPSTASKDDHGVDASPADNRGVDANQADDRGADSGRDTSSNSGSSDSGSGGGGSDDGK